MTQQRTKGNNVQKFTSHLSIKGCNLSYESFWLEHVVWEKGVMLMRLRSKILLHPVTTNRIAAGDRRRETRAAFLLWICVLTMTTMTRTAPARLAQRRVKQTTGASNVSHALNQPRFHCDTDVLCKHNMKNYHISPRPLILTRKAYFLL